MYTVFGITLFTVPANTHAQVQKEKTNKISSPAHWLFSFDRLNLLEFSSNFEYRYPQSVESLHNPVKIDVCDGWLSVTKM